MTAALSPELAELRRRVERRREALAQIQKQSSIARAKLALADWMLRAIDDVAAGKPDTDEEVVP